jgi:hypothetical protein
MLTIPAQARNNLTIPAPGKLARFIIYIFQKSLRNFSFDIIFYHNGVSLQKTIDCILKFT